MSEYKSLEEAYAAVCKERDRLNDFQNSQCARLLAKVNDLEKQLHESKSEWISVEDKLPNPLENVLVYSPMDVFPYLITSGFCGITGSGTYWYCGGHGKVNIKDNVITHWMPLPEPPKEV